MDVWVVLDVEESVEKVELKLAGIVLCLAVGVIFTCASGWMSAGIAIFGNLSVMVLSSAMKEQPRYFM